jgi:hypothetical protein
MVFVKKINLWSATAIAANKINILMVCNNIRIPM